MNIPKTVGEMKTLNVESLEALASLCEQNWDRASASEASVWERRAILVRATLADKLAEQDNERWSDYADWMEG